MAEAGFDNDVRAAVYRLFVTEGRAPVAAEVARAVSTTPAQVEDAFQRLHDAHLLVLAPGTPYIWMANPFSALPTPYTVTAGGKTFWGNCIWDGLGILAMLDPDGEVSGLCPDCGDELRVEIRDGALVPADHIVHFTVPARHWWDDIGFNWSHMLLFRSEEHLQRWRAERDLPQGTTFTLDQQWNLARIWYSDRTDPDWKRRSPAEAEAVFAEVGLTGPFWELA